MTTVAAYAALGWRVCAIPPNSKGPTAPGWNTNPLTVEQPAGWGLGLLHALSGTAALDIDDLLGATLWLAERGIDLDALLTAPDAVQIVSGRPGRAKLLYRVPMGMPLPTKKIQVDGVTLLEFRCASADGKSVQDVLPPSIHPDTGKPYQWQGDWRNLPMLPDALVTLWLSLLTPERPVRIEVDPATPPVDWKEVTSALYAISADCPRKTWVDLGMAVHDAAEKVGDNGAGFDLWDKWSAQSKKYHPAEMPAQWRSFKTRDDGITVGTLLHYASKCGWKRDPAELQTKFGPVDVPPEQIKKTLSPSQKAPATNLSHWPDALSARAVEVATEVGCDPIVPLVAGLAAISAAADKRTKLNLSGTWAVPPTIWLMTIGEPADKKTPGSKPMFSPLRQLEIDDKPRHAAAMLGYQGQEARYAAQLKAFREWSAGAESEFPGALPPEMGNAPPEPKPLRLLIQDATTQKVVSMSEGRPRGFLLYLDEMQRWLTKLSDTRHSDDRGCWIQGYETGAYTMDRQGAGTVHAENMALSIYGNCQPRVFRENIAGSSSDGLIQRFMPVALDPSKNAMWSESIPAFMSQSAVFDNLIRRIYALEPQSYQLSPGANEAFRDFSRWCLWLRENERLLNNTEAYQTALGKMEGNCARIMLLFHLVADPHNPLVSPETAGHAIDLMRQFFVPSLRHAFLEIGHQRDMMAQAITDYVLQCAGIEETVSLADLRKACKKHFEYGERQDSRADTAIRIVMEELALVGYVALAADHPRYPKWAINPAIAETFATERQRVIKAKQAILDEMGRVLTGRGHSVQMPRAKGNTPLPDD